MLMATKKERIAELERRVITLEARLKAVESAMAGIRSSTWWPDYPPWTVTCSGSKLEAHKDYNVFN